MNIVFTQILTSLCGRLQRSFMRRTGVRASLQWNFIIHQSFSEFLQPFRDLRITTGHPVPSLFPFLFGFGILLAWVSLGLSLIHHQSIQTLALEKHHDQIHLPDISPVVGEESEDEEKE